jgi:competence protein ComEA
MRVHVTGAVKTPGVYLLPAGARVEDALRAAGGATGNAAADLINLVEPLRDGQRLAIPDRAAASSPGQPAAGQPSPAAPGLLDVNQATAAQLEALPGIGPVLAGSIVEYRAANGPFARLEDLLRVPGIGPAKLEQLAPYLVAP